jgi:hypothetical protein
MLFPGEYSLCGYSNIFVIGCVSFGVLPRKHVFPKWDNSVDSYKDVDKERETNERGSVHS